MASRRDIKNSRYDDFSQDLHRSSSQTHSASSIKRHRIFQRSRFLFIAAACAFILCIVQLAHIQLFKGPQLARKALEARTFNTTISAQRGDIVDARGTVLATSLERYNIIVNQRQVKRYLHRQAFDRFDHIVTDKRQLAQAGTKIKIVGTGAVEAAKLLAPLLDENRAELGGKLVGDRGYLIIKKDVSPQVWNKIKRLRIDGIDGVKTYVRSYPNGATAASILGFTDIDSKGIDGIEKTMNKYLQGHDGKRSLEISPSGEIIPGGADEAIPAKKGDTLQLTINADLEHFAQDLLDKNRKKFSAEWGAAVVSDVKTGAILALADTGMKPPLEMRKHVGGTHSRCVESIYEPGSTAKLITFATALEQKKITPLSQFVVPYELTRGKEEFHDSHSHPVEHLTATGVLAQSSNVGTIQIGDRVSDAQRYQQMLRLGLGKLTGIKLPGETPGLVADSKKWGPRQRYTTMFGQGIGATPLQVLGIVSTIANDGVRVPFHIVARVKDSYGKTTDLHEKKPVEAMPQQVARTLRTMMESVTQKGGTGHLGIVPGYRTAVKTGTSEIPATHHKPKGVVASMAGFVPAENPRVAINVVFYRPQHGFYGAVVAGPVFSQIGQQAMTLLDVPPSTQKPDLYQTEW